MDAGTAALLALDARAKQHHYDVKVSEPLESDTGEFGQPDGLDDVEFETKLEALDYCYQTARRGLRACLYEGCRFIGEFE